MVTNDRGAENVVQDARLAVVEEHVQQENQHDLDGIMATFGEDAWYADEPWGEHHAGRDGVSCPCSGWCASQHGRSSVDAEAA